LSVLNKKWVVADPIPREYIKKYSAYSLILLQLLFNRGIVSQEKIDSFFRWSGERDKYDPMLFKGMSRAIERILQAYNQKERVAIFGDYDADGVTSSVLLMEFFRDVLDLRGQVYIPDRLTEGYGMNKDAINWLFKKDINLIVTCDCGVSNKEEIDYARNLGIDVIVTDHHSLPHEFTTDYVIINPKQKNDSYPFKELAGVGVAYKLVQALIKNIKLFKNIKIKEEYEKKFLDLVAIGTIADCSPIISENRAMVIKGLEVLKKTDRQGLLALFALANVDKKKINAYTVGFAIAPRINSAGRLDHANASYKLLATSNKEEAQALAYKINKANVYRQKLTERIIIEAKKNIGKINKTNKLLFAVGKEWPLGVLGIVAGKISEEYNRPVIVASRGKDQTVGSARSIDSFNIIQWIANNKEILLEYGGHKKAAGFTVSNQHLNKFINNIKKTAEEIIKDSDLTPLLNIDMVLNIEKVNLNLFDELNKLEPFGINNEKPQFLFTDLRIKKIIIIGKEKKHIKIEFSKNNGYIEGIGFYLYPHLLNLKVDDIIDIVAGIDLNHWNGCKKLQLLIKDVNIK